MLVQVAAASCCWVVGVSVHRCRCRGLAGGISAVDGDAEVLVASPPGPESASASGGCHGWFGPDGGDRETAAYFAGLSAGLDVAALPQLGGDLPIRLVADSVTTGRRRRLLWGLAVHGRELEIDRPRRALTLCTCRQPVRTICPASRAKGGKYIPSAGSALEQSDTEE